MIRKGRNPGILLCLFLIIGILMTAHTAKAEEAQSEARIGSQYFDTIESALEAAQRGQTVILIRDAEINRDVTVAQGVMLLLPADETDSTGYAAQGFNPENQGRESSPYQYHQLTISSEATMTIQGTVLVNAVTGLRQSGVADGYDVSGGYSQINLLGKIQVVKGGFLDVFGYVNGTGNIHVQSGGKVSDLFVIRHWRGGSYAAAVVTALGTYPMNEYDMHNITSAMRIDSGGVLTGAVRIFADNQYRNARFPQIDNSNGIYRLNAGGYAIKTLESGREVLKLYGGASFDKATLNLEGMSLSTGDYYYPMDGDMTLEMHDGIYKYKARFKHMPGTLVTVAADAVLYITRGTTNQQNAAIFYDESFQDLYTKRGTAYPSGRGAAKLVVEGELHVLGQVAGQVVTSNQKKVILGPQAITEVTMTESGSEDGRGRDFKIQYQLLTPSGQIQDSGSTGGSTGADTTGPNYTSKIGTPKSFKSASISGNYIKLSWKKAEGAVKYVIYRATVKNGVYKQIGTTSKLAYTDKTAEAGKVYYYKLYGASASKNGKFTKIIKRKAVPPSVQNMRISARSGRVILKWKALKKISSYQIYRANSQKGKYKLIGETKRVRFIDKSIKKNKSYYYKIRAYVKNGTKKIYGSFSSVLKGKEKQVM